MGNELSPLSEESVESMQWSDLNSKDLYVELSSSSFSANKEFLKKVCQNCIKSNLIPIITQKVFELWDNEYLTANLLHLFKHFLLFIFSERIPYAFLYEDTKKPISVQYESSFHRLVPCSLTFQKLNKTIYISVPQTGDFDRAKEQLHMIETIKSHFTEVNDYVMRNNEKIYLTDDNGKVLGIEEIFRHYSNNDVEELVDPFKAAQTRHFTVFKANVKTMECDLASPMSGFIKGLVERIVQDELKGHLARTHASLEIIVCLLASHLYWLEKPVGRITYSLFRPSPALDILMSLPLELAQMLSRILIDYSCSHWKPHTKLSLFSTLLSSFLDIRLHEIEYKTPQLSLWLLLLLNSSAHSPNPFKISTWEMKWESISKVVLKNISSFSGLLLFVELLMRNPSFYNHILSLSDPEVFLEPLLGEIYSYSKNTERVHLIMVLLVILSKDKIFIRFINKDVILTSVSWLKEYRIDKISLGSLFFLALVRLVRENLRTGMLDYIHVSSIACLFNISSALNGLSELASMEYLSLCKALFSKYWKINSKQSSELQMLIDLIHLMIEILCKIMANGLALNPCLVQAILHHSEFFSKLKHSPITNQHVSILCECIEACMKTLDSENILESIIHTSKVYSLSGFTAEILTCKEFGFHETPLKWEEFITPYIWMEMTREVFCVPNVSRVVLFRHN